MKKETDGERLSDLVELACRLGASKAGVIRATDIRVEDGLANLCKDPQCENYGQSPSCPPHVSGPAGFRKLLKDFEHALVFKIEVPSEVLFSNERREIFELLHHVAADIEQAAVRAGYPKSRAFAGGSCKRIFCRDYPGCRVLSEGGECRSPEHARPSMSGFGINVSRLMEVAGWAFNRAASEEGKESGDARMGSVCGLVLIG